MSILQQRINELLHTLVADGRERGLQVAAYVDGRLAVNAWAGMADVASGALVDADSLFPVFSVTKGVVAALVHLLVERGQLSYHDKVSKFWPEFGKCGKQAISVQQVLNHSAGIPQMPRSIGHAELCDWERMCEEICNLEPLWKPGSRIEYHAMTFGWVLGEVARRVDGRFFSKLLYDEICQPLGIEDMYAGIPDHVEPRVATLEDPEAPAPVDDGKPQSVPAWIGPLATWMNGVEARRACIPASNGIMTAHAISRFYAALLPCGVDGVEILPPNRVKIATEAQKPECAEGDYPKNWGLGFQIGGSGSLYGESAAAFGHNGYGGSVGFADPNERLAVGFTRNLFNDAETPRLILEELRSALAAERNI